MRTYETDCIMPSIGELLTLPDAAVRVIFAAVGLCKLHSDGRSCSVISNSVEDFKSKNLFDNQHLEISIARMRRVRMPFIKLGHCDLRPETMWKNYKNKDKEMSIPRILGKCRTSLKLIDAAFKKHLISSEICKIALHMESLKKMKMRKKIIVCLLQMIVAVI